ncbi:hypothetical protein [Pseudomonas hamedanensis]|uniref:Halovibrin HvnC n=1 Tax=Pseudomonas hamedanensis TaxID=2745504 RepID=A0A9E6TIG9_9PSED|nr:hypothetical protein [Pseudomonas hamedanensis]QXI19252.1 hypothetical protein HU739_009755 [Pseudomonas hamedanensis]
MKYFLFLIIGFSTAVHAMSGQALVTDLNARFNSNVAQCSNGAPAYHCSGILLRAVDYSAYFKFWEYGSKATALGSVAFTYIRSDVGSMTLNSNRKSGFILKDQISALAEDKAVNLRCIFPFPTESLDDRADHGCGFAPKVGEADVDLANCAKLAVPAVTTAAWLKNFQEHSSLPKNQCSLSTRVATQFKAGLEAHNMIDATWTAKPTEVLVETWDEKMPEKLPVEAVFYDASTPAKLVDAQKFQRDYYHETSLFVPVVKFDRRAANGVVFSYNSNEQRLGQLVAEQLNIRYSNITEACDGKAAFFCSGVLIRTTKATTNYHAWDPSPTSIALNGVAFSYLRQDIKMTRLYNGEVVGFIFKALDLAYKAGSYPTPVRCSFPRDAATERRVMSCGHYEKYPEAGESCLEIGVKTLAEWKEHYHSHYYRGWYQCSLGPEKEQFSIFLKARDNFDYAADLTQPNEVILAVWPAGIPRKLPLDAFFYVENSGGLVGAKFMQQDYFEQAGDYLPVIRVTINAGVFVFSFHEADQVVAK